MKNKLKEKVNPVKGAAKYWAGHISFQPVVFMQASDGHISVVDNKRTIELAEAAAQKWQKKENEAVLKAMGRI